MKNKILLVLVLLLCTLGVVSAKSVTNWWSGYTTIDDFDFGKVHAFYRAWDYDDGSRVYVTVYTDVSETRVRYENGDLGNKARLPFAQITEVSSDGARTEYNLVNYSKKFKDFQFTLYSADEKTAEFSFSGTVNVCDGNINLISTKVSQEFNASDAKSISDIDLRVPSTDTKSSKTTDNSELILNKKSDLEIGLDFLSKLFAEPEPEHPTGTKICSYCHGSGKCAYCHGSGKDPAGFLSYCSHCDFMGNGICSWCDGRGWVY